MNCSLFKVSVKQASENTGKASHCKVVKNSNVWLCAANNLNWKNSVGNKKIRRGNSSRERSFLPSAGMIFKATR